MVSLKQHIRKPLLYIYNSIRILKAIFLYFLIIITYFLLYYNVIYSEYTLQYVIITLDMLYRID